jgi:hypothetical protein
MGRVERGTGSARQVPRACVGGKYAPGVAVDIGNRPSSVGSETTYSRGAVRAAVETRTKRNADAELPSSLLDRRRGHPGQDGNSRIRRRRPQSADHQPARPTPHARWIIERLGRRRGRLPRASRVRHTNRRIADPACFVLRALCTEAELGIGDEQRREIRFELTRRWGEVDSNPRSR